MPKQIVIRVPDELPERDAKIAIAVRLLRDEKLTLKQAGLKR